MTSFAAERLDRSPCCGLTSVRRCFRQKPYFQYLEYLGFVLRDNSLKQLESVFSSYIDVDNGTMARYVTRRSTSLRGAYCVLRTGAVVSSALADRAD